ncbi:MAG: helix-turn-helix transcriptional regulator [Opitutae bacterium]
MFAIEILKDWNGDRFYTIFEHGRFHQPIMVVTENEAKFLADYILAGQSELSYVPDNKTIASAVTRERKRRKLSQEEAGEQIGVSRNYLALIETCKANMSIDVYRLIVSWIANG